MKKKIFLVLLFVGISVSIWSQSSITFSYDAAGNCTERKANIVARSALSPMADSLEEGSEESLDQYTILIYPNPTQGIVSIEIKDKTTEIPLQLILSNSVGQPLKSLETKETLISLDLTPYLTGAYVLKIQMKEQTKELTILKQ